jgi:hypothetical protein
VGARGFQRRIVGDLFAGVRELWSILPEGNGKTTLMAGVALYGAHYCPEPVDPDRCVERGAGDDSAHPGAGFVRRSGLEKRFRIYEYRGIGSIKQGGVGIRAYAADERTAGGAIRFRMRSATSCTGRA